MNKGMDSIEIDDEEYAINATFLVKKFVINSNVKFDMKSKINICVSFFKAGKDKCAFEFK